MSLATTHTVRSTRFGGLEVLHDDRVLTPRPWTLLQSAWGADLAAAADEGRVLELCAGVGHIGQEVARRSGRVVIQVDADPRACELARVNAARNGLTDQVEVRCADLGRALTPDEASFPVILADPPYLPTADCEGFPEDPVVAVDGGPDGLTLVRRVLAVIRSALRPDGVALVQLRGRSQLEGIDAGDLRDLGCSELRSHDHHRAVAAFVHDPAERVGSGRKG